MKSLFCLLKLCLLSALAIGPASAAIVTFLGNSYSSPNVRTTWLAQLPALTYDNVVLSGAGNECVSPCGYTYNSGPAETVNVSGQTISGVTFAGSNSAVAGSGLYVRPTGGSRNSFYNPLTGNGGFPQWVTGLATVQGAGSGFPTITITLPSGTRSAGFDFGNINSSSANLTITATTAGGGTSSVVPTNRYDTGTGTPNYLTTGPGFYGVTSSDDDIVTITIIGNANNGGWVLNIANFRFGVQTAAPVPEPATQLTLGAVLIAMSIWLRQRNKSSRGGNA
jgi:hypothetical protein